MSIYMCVCMCGSASIQEFLLVGLAVALSVEVRAKSCVSCGFDFCPGQVEGARHSKPLRPAPLPRPWTTLIKYGHIFSSTSFSLGPPSFQMHLVQPKFKSSIKSSQRYLISQTLSGVYNDATKRERIHAAMKHKNTEFNLI